MMIYLIKKTDYQSMMDQVLITLQQSEVAFITAFTFLMIKINLRRSFLLMFDRAGTYVLIINRRRLIVSFFFSSIINSKKESGHVNDEIVLKNEF